MHSMDNISLTYNFYRRSLGHPIKVIMTPNHNCCIDCTGIIFNESTSAGCGKKGKKSKTFGAIHYHTAC